MVIHVSPAGVRSAGAEGGAGADWEGFVSAGAAPMIGCSELELAEIARDSAELRGFVRPGPLGASAAQSSVVRFSAGSGV